MPRLLHKFFEERKESNPEYFILFENSLDLFKQINLYNFINRAINLRNQT